MEGIYAHVCSCPINSVRSERNVIHLHVPLKISGTSKWKCHCYPKSEAAYKVHQHFVIISLWKMLNAYELRQNNPHLPLWDIGNRINEGASAWEKGKRIDWPKDLPPNPKTPDAAEMASLASATSRMIRKAQKAIENTGKEKFPKFN